MVPLMPCAHTNSGEQPWSGLLLEQHSVTAIEIPEHEHGELCLHLQVSGEESMEWWSDGRHGIENSAPGSMILLPAGTRDRILWHGASERLILSLRSNLLSRITEEAETADPEFKSQWSFRDGFMQHLIVEMGREASEGWPLGHLYADLVAMGLATSLLRRHAAVPVELGEVKGGMPMPRLRRAMEYMTENLDSDLTLEDIAQELSLSSFHFAREFRGSTGQTPYQYLLDQRIERAKHLLKIRNWPIQDVASLTGFRSLNSFVRSFRQRVGQTPGDWRKSA
jgi:AraC family transcriptional regulator